MRRLAVLSVFLALPGLGCAAQAWPPAFAFGQSRIQSGPCERWYTPDGYLERERCEGDAIEGGAISDAASRGLGTVGVPLMRIGAGLAGVPLPGDQPPPPQPPPKATGP